MGKGKIFLIDHKATLADNSPLNLDGSEWIKGVCVVPAESEKAALEGFRTYMVENRMEEIEVYHVEQYLPENFSDSSKRTRFINHGVRVASDRGIISYTCGQTSETLADTNGDAEND